MKDIDAKLAEEARMVKAATQLSKMLQHPAIFHHSENESMGIFQIQSQELFDAANGILQQAFPAAHIHKTSSGLAARIKYKDKATDDKDQWWNADPMEQFVDDTNYIMRESDIDQLIEKVRNVTIPKDKGDVKSIICQTVTEEDVLAVSKVFAKYWLPVQQITPTVIRAPVTGSEPTCDWKTIANRLDDAVRERAAAEMANQKRCTVTKIRRFFGPKMH